MTNQPTKHEVLNFTHYGNVKGVAKCIKWGGLGWLGVTRGH